jgi:hypothetical protein
MRKPDIFSWEKVGKNGTFNGYALSRKIFHDSMGKRVILQNRSVFIKTYLERKKATL